MYKLLKRKLEGCDSSNRKYQEFFTKEELKYIKNFMITQREKVGGFDKREYTSNISLLERNEKIPFYEFLEIWSHIDLLKLDYPNYTYSEFEEKLREKCKKAYFKK